MQEPSRLQAENRENPAWKDVYAHAAHKMMVNVHKTNLVIRRALCEDDEYSAQRLYIYA